VAQTRFFVGIFDSSLERLIATNHHVPQKSRIGINWHALCIV
jgi:hypothetical protein